MHYSLLIQGLTTNGTLEWINLYKYRNSTITSFTVLFRLNQVMFNYVNTINVDKNTNDEEITIPPGYLKIGEIIAMLSTMNDTSFSISTKASSYGFIWIQSSYSIFFQCHGYSRHPRIRMTDGHSISFFLWIEHVNITRNRQVIPMYSPLVGSLI